MRLYVATLEVIGETNEFIEEGDDLIAVLMLFQDRATLINKALLAKYPDLDEESLCKVTGVVGIDLLRFSEAWASNFISELVVD